MIQVNQTRIAVIDDDEDDYFIINELIQDIDGGNFLVDWLPDYQSAIDKMRAKEYDLYFVDYRLGNETGLELLQEASSFQCEQPVVILTGKGNKSIDIRAMQSGATDYLVKTDLNPEKLERCIRYSLERAASLVELRAREKKYRNLFRSSKDAVFISDKNLFFVENNESASRIFGLKNGELRGHSLFEFIRDEAVKAELHLMLDREEDIDDLEIVILSKHNEIRPCLLSVSFQKDLHHKYFVHGVLHDITNIRRAEQANIQSQKLSANERLIRILAHEIRNPLNNITLAADQLKTATDDVDTQVFLVGIVQRNCTRINKIITELLDLTKPLELRFEKYALQDVLDESLSQATDRINLQQVKVQKIYPDSPLEINADKAKLIIAFTNLVINAIEAMETNKGELTVSVASLPNTYSVSIRDNGKGIPEEFVPKLFEPFFTSKKNGLGLGLAACHSIIQSHKGTISVESTIDVGSNFIVSFSK